MAGRSVRVLRDMLRAEWGTRLISGASTDESPDVAMAVWRRSRMSSASKLN